MPSQQAVAFFYEQAGWSYNPSNETAEEGRARGALRLATAEDYAQTHDWMFAWEPDPEPCYCDADSHEHEVEFCVLFDRAHDDFDAVGRLLKRRILASLYGICGATREYRRVVEAELALEAMPAGVDHA
jgi:hypothetical protein